MTDTHPTDSPIFEELVQERAAQGRQSIEDTDQAECHGGPGDLDNLPESDFVSFATDEVHKEESA